MLASPVQCIKFVLYLKVRSYYEILKIMLPNFQKIEFERLRSLLGRKTHRTENGCERAFTRPFFHSLHPFLVIFSLLDNNWAIWVWERVYLCSLYLKGWDKIWPFKPFGLLSFYENDFIIVGRKSEGQKNMVEFLKWRRKLWSISAIRPKKPTIGRVDLYRTRPLRSTQPIGGHFHLHYIFVLILRKNNKKTFQNVYINKTHNLWMFCEDTVL